MIEILKFCVEILRKIFSFWASVDINGFRPFWFLASCVLLSGLGSALIGFGELGGAMTRVATKSGVRNKVKFVNMEKLGKRRKN